MNKQTYLIVACVLLGVALFPLPYGYYQILRLIICGVSIWMLIGNYNKKINLPIGLFAIAIIYNPIFIINFEKIIWNVLNIITLIYFIYLILKNKYRA